MCGAPVLIKADGERLDTTPQGFMAIRVIEKGNITCDSCKKEIATVKSSREFFEACMVFQVEEKYTQIRCMECSEKPIPVPE